MINIKLKINKHYGSVVPTTMFWVDDFVDSRQLDELLNKSRSFAQGTTYNDLVNSDELHLKAVHTKDGWIVMKAKTIMPEMEDVQNRVLAICDIPEYQFMEKTRREPIPLARGVVAAAYYHFLGISFANMEKLFPTSRVNLWKACTIALPKFLNAKDALAWKLVTDLSQRYADPAFKTRCQEGNFMKRIRYADN